eukprot:12539496-Alexandrium_andersonii.AAC.1
MGPASGLGSLLAEHWPVGAVVRERAARAALLQGQWNESARVVLLSSRDDMAELQALAVTFDIRRRVLLPDKSKAAGE